MPQEDCLGPEQVVALSENVQLEHGLDMLVHPARLAVMVDTSAASQTCSSNNETTSSNNETTLSPGNDVSFCVTTSKGNYFSMTSGKEASSSATSSIMTSLSCKDVSISLTHCCAKSSGLISGKETS